MSVNEALAGAKESGSALFDTSEKIFEDIQANPGEKAFTFMHTVPYEGSAGLVNLLTTTRVRRRGCDTTPVVYPSVMVNAELYQQYIQVVRAIVDELREVHTERDLVRTWHEQRSLGSDTVARLSPSMGMVMNADAVRDAAFCQRHREVMREH